MEMAVRSMETAETAMEIDGDGSGGTSRPGRVPEQRLMSPEICLQWRRSCGSVLGKTPIVLGFSVGRLFIGERASSGGDQGGLTTGGTARGWVAPPHGEAGPWPPSGSRSVFDTLPGIIRLLEFVSSNSENISCIDFLKYKNSRK
jgi:hypothetical protein